MTVKVLGRLPDGDGLQSIEAVGLVDNPPRFLAIVELRVVAVTHHINGDDEYTVTLAIEAVEPAVDPDVRAGLLAQLRNMADDRKGTPALPYKD